MTIRTLIIGYVPLTDLSGKKSRALKEDAYFKELLPKYDLGEVHFASHNDWQTKITEVNPLFTIVLGGDWYAQQVKDYKGDIMLYVSYAPSQIFHRKAEVEDKKEEQHKTLAEIAGLITKAREKGDVEIEAMRKFAAMSYKDMYDMIKQGLLSKDKKLHDSAWDLLFGEGERHSNLVWMRVNLLADVWDGADGKGREELMCLAMGQHVSNGLARKLDNFTDADGQQYHQYMFCNFFDQDLNYIRRIPFGEKGQDKWAYEKMLTDYETPANFVRVMLEASQLNKQKEEYFKEEATKVARVLAEWKEHPEKSMQELGVVPYEEGADDQPMTEQELGALKRFLQKHDKNTYTTLFSPMEVRSG